MSEQQMTKLENIDKVFELYIKYLEDSHERFHVFFEGAYTTEWHVVFSFGTTVTLELSDEPLKSFPSHRLIKDRIWNIQKEEIGLPGKALRIAFKHLIDDGYSFAKDPSENEISLLTYDGTPTEYGSRLYATQRPHRSTLVYNLTLGNDETKAKHLGEDLRRNDYVQPKVYAIISPDLVVIKL
uniref:Uncharacterized protein n=1 Tax=Pithovirus LCPAC401 TaxID=2506595 RepID=A0A481ZBS4_9VIRU|nr:MAG: hypothetical protein LCPAC401_01670 [Pithovirus LCPAC401]